MSFGAAAAAAPASPPGAASFFSVAVAAGAGVVGADFLLVQPVKRAATKMDATANFVMSLWC